MPSMRETMRDCVLAAGVTRRERYTTIEYRIIYSPPSEPGNARLRRRRRLPVGGFNEPATIDDLTRSKQ